MRCHRADRNRYYQLYNSDWDGSVTTQQCANVSCEHRDSTRRWRWWWWTAGVCGGREVGVSNTKKKEGGKQHHATKGEENGSTT